MKHDFQMCIVIEDLEGRNQTFQTLDFNSN